MEHPPTHRARLGVLVGAAQQLSQPALLRLGVVVQKDDELACRRPAAEVGAAGEAAVHEDSTTFAPVRSWWSIARTSSSAPLRTTIVSNGTSGEECAAIDRRQRSSPSALTELTTTIEARGPSTLSPRA